ncbi:Small nuclear ribonucleoprotein family protein [Abeliophyllum distichum]|uniref:Small nuclear ribonucleoprotein family protein n=1 Tax=Abeliophyllum distichum TaxID=126358 RepID=A0ABD1QHJ8_9LAMI
METPQQAESSVNHAGSSDASESNGSNYVARVKKLLFRPMLVGIKDGRFFIGTFYCMDKQGNIILQDAVEYRSTRRFSPSPMEHRGVGLILIPFSCRTSCHVDCAIEEQLSLLSLQEKKS